MQTAASGAQLSPIPTSFAGILASATDPPWNDDGLADDVATISYERALRAHARPGGATPQKEADPDPPRAAPAEPGAGCRKLKTASITLRLSEPECAQVRQRAEEAGLTVSAYLRSCALEVESLRAQVKETLAQLRSSPAQIDSAGAAEPTGRSRVFSELLGWFRHRGPVLRG